MALSGPMRPQLAYTTQLSGSGRATPTTEEIEAETLVRALDLARQLEELLEDTRSIAVGAGTAVQAEDPRTHSTRMARAMAASLVDELDALVRPSRVAATGTRSS